MEDFLKQINSQTLASICDFETGKKISSEDFKVAIAARSLLLVSKYNIEAGSIIVLEKKNSISFFIDFLALLFLECTIIPIDPQSTSKDKEIIYQQCSPVLIISNEHETVKTSHRKLKDISLILFTSGSTGEPRGVLISKQALINKLMTLKKFIPIEEIQNTLCFLPTFFGHGLICNSLFPIFFGQHFFIANKLTIDSVGGLTKKLIDHEINFFSSVPSVWEILANFSPSIKDFKHQLLRVHCASAPLSNDKKEHIYHWLGDVPFYDVYGATEMLGWFAATRVNFSHKDQLESSFNVFWDAEVKLSHENSLMVSSDYLFSGYLNEQTTFDIFDTGDIFVQNKIIGRTKSFIKKNGIKIYTQEINNLILKSGLVHDVASFSIPHTFSGEDIGLYVVLKSPFMPHDFYKYIQTEISSLNQPHVILFTDIIPTNDRGKFNLKSISNNLDLINNHEEKLLKLINDVFGTKFLEFTRTRNQIPQWDSMKHAELILKIQKQFNFKFNVIEIQECDSLKALLNNTLNHITK